MKIGVIGLGLIGGSIFKDLLRLGYNVIAVSKSQRGDRIFDSYEAIKNCALVFVCSSMNNTLSILDELENWLPNTTVVTDVSSVKSFVCKKERPYLFVPSHPMAGTEKKGFEYSLENLFNDATWVITPFQGESEILENVISDLGAKIIKTSPQKHDEAVAMISHIPMIISQAIFKTIKNNELALKLASSGFRDTTRLAMSNTEMAQDMLNYNNSNIKDGLSKFSENLSELINNDYKSQIDLIATQRAKMFRK